MEESQTGNQPQGLPGSKAELLSRIQRSRSALEETLNELSEAQLTTPGPSGWSVKDHLAHLAAWELGIAALLRRQNRFAAMQIEQAVSQGKGETEINDLIYRLHAGLSSAEVRDKFQSAHRELLAAVEALGDRELFQPYDAFLSESSGERPDPVINWIIGNTYAHFDEHRAYIREQLT